MDGLRSVCNAPAAWQKGSAVHRLILAEFLPDPGQPQVTAQRAHLLEQLLDQEAWDVGGAHHLQQCLQRGQYVAPVRAQCIVCMPDSSGSGSSLPASLLSS